MIGLEKGANSDGPGITGPHPDPLCEKCHQLGYKCTRHGRRKKRKNKRLAASDVGSVGALSVGSPSVSAPSVGASSVGASGDMPRRAKAPPGVQLNGDVNNNEVSPQSTSKKRNKSRSRRKSSGKQVAGDAVVNELCQIMEKL